MDKIPDAIDKILSRLGTVLRYIAPGFVLLVLLSWASVQPVDFTDFGAKSSSVAMLIFASLAGVVIYAVHVNTIMRLTWRLIARYYIVKASKLLSQNFENTKELLVELDLQRWQRRGSSDDQVASIQRELNTWGAMLNFLYCTTIAIFVGIVVGWHKWEWDAKTLLFVGAFGAFVTALTSHIRFFRYELSVVQRFKQGQQSPNHSAQGTTREQRR